MGRVVAGIGSGGIFSGAILIIAASAPLAKRPIFNGLLGSMYAIASVAGPLMGGAFTDRVTWRLCFYINLPFGVVTSLCVLFFLSPESGRRPECALPLRKKPKDFDFYGLAIFIPMIVSLLLALQWGGSRYNWQNARIIALLVIAGVLLLAFAGLQWWQGDRATVPPSVIKQRTVWACSIFVFLLFGSFLAFTYFIPVWFQAIKDTSATQSGINNLPSIMGTVILSLVAGGLVFAVGYYTWTCIIGSFLAAIGAGLLTTFKPTTASAEWIGYQVIYGGGCGFGLQQPLIAVQTALPGAQIAEGTAIVIFMQTFGGAVFIAVAQNVFNNQLVTKVIESNIPVDSGALLSQGATQITSLVEEEYLPALKSAYNGAITQVSDSHRQTVHRVDFRQTFYVTVATAALSIFGSALIPWFSVKKKSERKEGREQVMEFTDRAKSNQVQGA